MNVHIVKRNPNLSDLGFLDNTSKIGSISQSAMGKKPIGWDANIGDEVWIHEIGYGITKTGIIKNKSKDLIIIPKNDFNSLISLFSSSNTKIKDRSYWWDLIQKMLDSPDKDLKYIEFDIEYNYLVEPIPCRFTFQGGWFTLKKSDLSLFEQDKLKSFYDISIENKDIESLLNIPTKIKVEIFNRLRLAKNDKTVIDFDHVIPKHVGGLGCFIENVQPIPKAVNRSKNKSVPLILFEVSKEYKDLQTLSSNYTKIINSAKDEFSRDKGIILLAQKIMKITHQWSVNNQREFYSKILEQYDNGYFKKIKS